MSAISTFDCPSQIRVAASIADESIQCILHRYCTIRMRLRSMCNREQWRSDMRHINRRDRFARLE